MQVDISCTPRQAQDSKLISSLLAQVRCFSDPPRTPQQQTRHVLSWMDSPTSNHLLPRPFRSPAAPLFPKLITTNNFASTRATRSRAAPLSRNGVSYACWEGVGSSMVVLLHKCHIKSLIFSWFGYITMITVKATDDPKCFCQIFVFCYPHPHPWLMFLFFW
jgi:hypothetical protein